ncbi:hypothetical protein GPS59_13195 [Acinetobacter haemolyticus]|uniref:hypothetical protein n=1 Tax=Acinetobacter haemolyticus TaxID=29430 RepID=UPI0002DD0D9A|nr:hypothetical protein [Acinetobacter haemolyticus]NAR51643.1 hypothetical protein [Acinetobacter haemolyticus]NAR54928.1 hypothetical protein [Acinetobacter haemolyticus]NAS00693.1 hypothetical protein [Acinetobacter haemolyticus]QHI25638.1 hypothetical protein Ahae2126ch_05140 [Acinetobacter haemolyticus]
MQQSRCIIKTGFLTSNSNHIQLKAGEYILKKELVPQVNVVIWGESPVNWNEQNILINDVVNQYPALTSLKTTIKAENSRIFNKLSLKSKHVFFSELV